jgi:iron complex transport system substrate-binding protein
LIVGLLLVVATSWIARAEGNHGDLTVNTENTEISRGLHDLRDLRGRREATSVVRAQARPQAAARAPSIPRRIVSLVPSMTEILFAVGAGPQVVAVSSFDTYPPQVKALPRVGALLDPDSERILSLHPDLVVIYGSQSDLQSQFARAGIRTLGYRHAGVGAVLDTIREVGDVSGHHAEGERVARDLQARLDAIRMRVRGRPRPRTLLVFERQPKTLRDIYASGGIGFLHDMLDIAGGVDVFADVQREAVQPSTELLLTRAPEVILEVRGDPLPANTLADERNVWSALPSLPAVRNGRIHFVTGEFLVVPGPRLADGVEALARALHPEAFGR